MTSISVRFLLEMKLDVEPLKWTFEVAQGNHPTRLPVLSVLQRKIRGKSCVMSYSKQLDNALKKKKSTMSNRSVLLTYVCIMLVKENILPKICKNIFCINSAIQKNDL